jgi:hypothetical protein
MARLVSLAKLRGLARLYADQRPGGADAFVPDTDGGVPSVASVNDLVNLAIAEFWDLLVAARGHDYARSSYTVPLVSGTKVYNLPTDFYEASSLVLEWSLTDIEPVRPYDRIPDRVSFNVLQWAAWAPKAYRVMATTFELVPTPTALPQNCRLIYVPTAPVLVNDVDTVDCVNGWEKLPALRVAMELRAIEEMPYSDLERLFDRERDRIMEMASERQAETPKQVQDVAPEGVSGGFARQRGPLP